MNSHEQLAQAAAQAPYHRIFIKEADGGFSACVLELPGVFGSGDSIAEANETLEAALEDWVLAELESGQTIPEPLESIPTLAA